jgi:Ca2+-binding RTX toxin-like protein
VAQRSNRFLMALIAAGAVALVAASVAMAATVIGNGSSNALTGTDQRDWMLGRGGDDTIDALAGADVVRAGSGDDTVEAGRGWDRVHGGWGNDTLNGDAGHDFMSGGRGDDAQNGGPRADLIFANRGRDRTDGGDGADRLWALSRFDVTAIGDPDGDELSGGNGRDRFRVRDGEVDLVHCGAEVDRVVADQFDQVDNDCERVVRRDVTSLDQVDDRQENRTENPS